MKPTPSLNLISPGLLPGRLIPRCLAALTLAFSPWFGVTAQAEVVKSPDAVPAGLEKSEWSSIRAAYEAGRHEICATEAGHEARNPGMGWLTKWDGRGFLVQPAEGNWQWGLQLENYGFPGAERPISGNATAQAEGQRLTYQWDANVEEWYVNDQRGVEHGFTVAQRPEEVSNPESQISNPLAFTLAVRGGLRPELSGDAQTVRFLDAAGSAVVTYSGLKVWDADGKVLPSHFAAAEEEDSFRLLVDERGARYPLTVDPLAQQAYLKASNAGEGDGFGFSVAADGNTVVIGAPYEDSSSVGVDSTSNEGAFRSGAAYVFVRIGSSWSQQAYLKAGNTGVLDLFGESVAISGNTIVVGASLEDGGNGGINPVSNEAETNSGAVYVFVRSGTVWSQQAYIKAPIPSGRGGLFGIFGGDHFGSAVAISGNTVVVGSPEDVGSGGGFESLGSGAAYVFTRSGTTWSQQAYFEASNAGFGDGFGDAVAISGETLVVGALGEASNGSSPSNNSASGSGAVYVFDRLGTIWTERAYLKASNAGANDYFGGSVAISGETLIVGANNESSDGSSPSDNSAPASGAAYVFSRSGIAWSQQAYLKAGNAGSYDRFGAAVAISGETVLVGAPIGAAYLFTRAGGTWNQQASLFANESESGDDFGRSVGISGASVIVGSPLEDSNTTGINSTPNELAPYAGAAYTFLFTPTAANVITQAATSITPRTATLNSKVYAGYSTTTMRFEYGVNPSSSLTTVSPTFPRTVSGNDASFASYNLSGLVAGQTYRFRAIGQNGVGTTNGAWLTFNTAPAAPTVTTLAATSITSTGAVLNGTVLRNGADASVYFRYSAPGVAGLNRVATPSLVTTTASTPVSASLTGLLPGTTYTFATRASNSAGEAAWSNLTFTTLPDPAVGGLAEPAGAAVAGGSVYGSVIQPDGRTLIFGDFTSVGGQPRGRMTRLLADGTLEGGLGFDPGANGDIICAALLADGKIMIGGNFTTLQPRGTGTVFARSRIARLLSDGTVDTTFANPGINAYVLCMAVQPDGAVLVGGDFNGAASFMGATRNRIARITPAGTLDTGFNPNANGPVYGIALQLDGKVLLGGAFTTMSTVAHARLARVDGTTGLAEVGYTPSADLDIYSIALQRDGRALAGGAFGNMNGTARGRLARLNADGTLDTSFNPNITGGNVFSIALQANQKMVLGGSFTNVSTTPRNKVARLDTTGVLDGFNPNVTGGDVRSIALQADGKVQLGGTFTAINGGAAARAAYALLSNETAYQTLEKRSATEVYWSRGGSAPEVLSVTFDQATFIGTVFTPVGSGTRVDPLTGDWRLSGISPSLPLSGQIRARARTASGYLSGSTGIMESKLAYIHTLPGVTTVSVSGITGTTALLTGTVNTSTLTATPAFKLDTTTAYTQPLLIPTPASVTGTATFTYQVTGLTPGTAYVFRATAENPGGRADGTDIGFTTLSNLQVDYKADGSDNAPTVSSYTALGRQVSFSLARPLLPGTTLMVVNNTGSAPINGTFANLAQGQTVSLTFGGVSYPFVANYFGGTGNDLVLVWANTRMLAWGWDNGLQLGLGYQPPGGATGTPTPVSPGVLAGKTITTMAAGFLHSVALCVDGTVATWGYNLEGQLGDGTNSQRGIPNAVDFSFLPAGVQITAISAGYNHTLALASNGAVYAWGDNEFGQLGHGDVPNDSNLPTQVDISGVLSGPGKNVIGIAAGARHSLAVCEDGTLVSWGWGSSGQLGNNGTANQPLPVAIDLSEFGFGFGEKVTLLAGGTNYSVAATNTGKMLAWGNNRTGQLGDGTTTQRTSPVLISSAWTGGSPIVSLSAGGGGGTSDLGLTGGFYFTTARAANGRLAAWGSNVWGQMTDGNLSLVQTVPLWLSDRGAVTQSASGSGHVLAIAADTLGAWGLGNEGRLGDQNVTTHVQPVPTAVSYTLGAGERWLNVYGGPEAQHSLALVAGPPPPIVTTLAATAVGHNSVTLHGTVNANNNNASLLFQYGQDASYAVTTGVTATPATSSGNVVTPISITLTGLTPSTIYHFRAAATAGATTATGADFTFTTLGDPAIAGTVDGFDIGTGFSGGTYTSVYAVVEQPDGKLLVAGNFTQVNGQPRTHLCRFNADGSLDAGFAPALNHVVYALGVQTDGAIVIAGDFITVNGVARGGMARLSSAGVLDTAFTPRVGGVLSMAIQPDGKILIGGLFSSVQSSGAAAPEVRNHCARLNPDGTLDSFAPLEYAGSNPVRGILLQPDGQILLSARRLAIGATRRNGVARFSSAGIFDAAFNPNPIGPAVDSIIQQADGSVVLGGRITAFQPGESGAIISRLGLGRVGNSGTLDAAFDPMASGVNSMGLQANGALILGGGFTAIQGHGGTSTPRGYAGRVNGDGSLDGSFDPGANGEVRGLTLLSSGKVLIYGSFTQLAPNGGPSYARAGWARLNNVPATQTLSVTSASRVQWLRGGASPESNQVTFELSTDGGATFTPLGPTPGYGAATRIAGGWEMTGLSLPTNGRIRARARIYSHNWESSSTGLSETLLPYSLNPPLAFAKPATDITDTTATLQAQVDPNDNSTTVSFSYGLSSSYEIGTASATPASITASGITFINGPIAGLLPGTVYHYTLNYSSSAGSGSTPDATFTTLTRLQAWRQLHFGTTANAGNAADLADFDNDGIANLTEFAFGLHPLQPSANQLPELSRTGGQMVYEFTEPDTSMGITYGAEWSPTMAPGSWLPLPDEGSGALHTFKLSTVGLGRAFMRLRVSTTAP